MAHTPTPWREEQTAIIGGDNDMVCDTGYFLVPKNKANIGLIVRAVNCHDELVAALETMIARLDCRKKWEDPDREAYHAARSALARATGE